MADPALEEISGIVAGRVTPGALWVHEDSGGPVVVTALHEDGTTWASVTLEGATNLDWEDLAAGPCPQGDCLYVGDIGDNAEAREHVRVYRLAEPDLSGVADGSALTAEVEVFVLRYPDGPHNAEALVVTPDGALWILTKTDDGAARRYAVASLPAGGSEGLTLEPAGTVDTIPEGDDPSTATLVTGADLSADGRLLVVRTYSRLWWFAADPDSGALSEGTAFQAGVELQGEAVAITTDGLALWHVGELEQPPLYRLDCADAARR